MKKLLYIFYTVGLVFAQPDFKGLESEVNDAEVSVNNLDTKDIKTVTRQEEELIILKEKLERTKKKIENQNTLENLKLNTFTVELKAAFNEKNEVKDTLSDDFRQGDILEFSSIIQYPKLKDEVTSVIQWQLFDEKGNRVENYFKERDFDLINSSKTHTFKIRLGQNLSSGKYKVALTHFLKSHDNVSYQAVKSFEIKQEIQIISLQLFNSPRDTKERKIFYHDETPHMYVNFKLSSSIKKVNVIFSALNQEGKVLYEYEGQRERKGETQRAGIKISDLKAGDTITFHASIISSDGYEISQSKSFNVQYYPLDIIAHFKQLEYNESKSFKLNVPQEFKKPYKVMNLINSSDYTTSINNTTLEGTLRAKNNDNYEKFPFMKIVVIDSTGKEAVSVHSMRINPKKQEVKGVEKISKPKPTVKSNINKSKPTFTFDTINPTIKEKVNKPQKYSSIKKGLTQNEKIALGEKRFSEAFKNFNKVLPSCYQPMNISSEVRKMPMNAKEAFGELTTVSSIWKFEKEVLEALVNLNIKHNIVPNFYKNDQCAIELLNRLKRRYPNAIISPYSYAQLSKKMTSNKNIKKVDSRASQDILKCKNEFKKYQGFLKKGGYYGLGGSFALSRDGRFCGMSQVSYSSSNRMQDSMNNALNACNSRRKQAEVEGSCSIIHKTIKANIR